MRILSANKNGALSKLEEKSCIDLLSEYDIVFLDEIKTAYPFSVAGFVTQRSKIIQGEEMRGGVAVLFNTSIWPHVVNIVKLKDQVWFKLKTLPRFQF